MNTPDTAADALAQWILVNEPKLFDALLARTPQSVGGIADIIGSIGSGIAVAAKNVGSFIASPEGMGALTALSGVVLQSRMQKDALKIQIKQAQAGQPPAPIQTQTNPTTGTTAAYYYPQGQLSAPIPLTPQVAAQLMPKPDYVPWAIGGAAVFVMLALFLARR
jgi:hypothetical protein